MLNWIKIKKTKLSGKYRECIKRKSRIAFQIIFVSLCGIAALTTNSLAEPVIGGVSLSGTASYNQQLTATVTESGDPSDTYLYQWGRATDASCSGQANIGGATASTYIITTADIGSFLCITVTPKDTLGNEGTAKTATTNSIVSKADQDALVVAASPSEVVFNGVSSVTVSGGSGTGVISYAVELGAESCLLDGNNVTAARVGSCTIVVTQAEDENYKSATASVQLNVTKASQTLTLSDPGTQIFSPSGTFVVVANSDSGLSVDLTSASAEVCTVLGSTVTMVAAGTCELLANQFGDDSYSAAQKVLSVNIGKAEQTLTLVNPGIQLFTPNGTFVVAASSDSGLPVELSSTSAEVCKVAGSTVTMLNAGVCRLSANQIGDDNYSSALEETLDVNIGRANQVITLTNLGAQTYSPNGAIGVAASSDSGLTVVLTSSSTEVCTVANNKITMVKAGVCQLSANQEGDDNYFPATQKTLSVIIAKANQLLTLVDPGVQAFSLGGTFEVSVSSDSGLAVTLSSTSADVCTVVGSLVTMVKAGICQLSANQAGDNNYFAATQETQSVSIGKAGQVLTLVDPGPQIFSPNGTFEVAATSDAHLPVILSSSSTDVCTVLSNTVTMLKTGICQLLANQVGDESYTIATQVSRSVSIDKASQVITFVDLGTQAFSLTNTFEVNASSDSGLAVALSSSSSDVCAINGNAVSMLKIGICQISANQAGDENYLAMQKTLLVSIAQATQELTLVNPGAQIYTPNGTFEVEASSNVGLTVVLTTSSPEVCTVSGNVVTMLKTGACELSANQAGDANYVAAEEVTESVSIGKANQVLTFTAIDTKTFSPDGIFEAVASSSSGLAVTLTSSSPEVCTISGSTVTMLMAGTCQLSASQAGDDNYQPAEEKSLSVIIAKSSQDITFELANTMEFILGGDFEAIPVGGSSEEVVVLISETNEVCAVSGNTVTMLSLGGCILTASQTGNENYHEPESLSRTIYFISSKSVVDDVDSNGNGVTDILEQTFGSGDDDNDGIPNVLEALLGIDVNSMTDSDGDGTPDVIEVLNGRDPTVDDRSLVGAPIVTASSPRSLPAKNALSIYSDEELEISATDADTKIEPVAYYALGACKEGVPYNYKAVCTQVSNTGFVSGTQSIWWIVTDSDNNWGVAKQTLNILPQVNFKGDLVLAGAPGSGSVTTQLVLSGPAISVPDGEMLERTIGYTVSGTGVTPEEHDLSDGVFVIQPGATTSDPITITLGSEPSHNSTVVISLDTNDAGFAHVDETIDTSSQFVFEGQKISQTITISQSLTFPPYLSELRGRQGEVKGLVFDKSQGDIVVSFAQVDFDGGEYLYNWAGSNSALGLSGETSNSATIFVDELGLTDGKYYIEIEVTDKTAPNSSPAVLGSMITLLESNTLSLTKDSDGDGRPDAEEGLGDSDGDGLPDYQDPYNQLASILPSNESDKYNYLVKAASGLRVIFGTTAIAAQTGDTKIVLDDLIDYGDKGKSADVASPDNVTLSHLFDYEVENLATPKDPSESGYTAKVTLPLDMPLGADTAFIKYDAVNGWRDFVENDENKITWANWSLGEAGRCPKVGDTAYTNDVALKSGASCVQVLLQDGGPNDADGVVNGRIIDPLGIGLKVEPVAEEPVTEEPVTEEPVTEEPVTEEPVAATPEATATNVTINTENNDGSGGGSITFIDWILGFTLLLGRIILPRCSSSLVLKMKKTNIKGVKNEYSVTM